MSSLSRRGFLQLGSAALASLWLPPVWQEEGPRQPVAIGRVLAPAVLVYQRTSLDSRRVAYHYYDNLIPLYDQVEGRNGPANNPIWYSTDRGYVHSSWVQWIPPQRNTIVLSMPEDGFIGEVTAPFVDARRKPAPDSAALYRLYYSSAYRVHGVSQGEDGRYWYRLHDDRLDIHYYVPAITIRRVPDAELTPISPEVTEKRIEVSLADQTLVAYEEGRPVLTTTISSGRVVSSSDSTVRKYLTPAGKFRVERKNPSRHMGNGLLSPESEYELPGVPWVSYFHWTGVAFHGTYWHNDFGRAHSQGCINMRIEEARWLYRWTHPIIRPGEETAAGEGTEVETFR